MEREKLIELSWMLKHWISEEVKDDDSEILALAVKTEVDEKILERE